MIETISPKAGIASVVQLVIVCQQHAHQKIAVVRMLQGGSVETIPLWQMVWCLVKFVTIGQAAAATGTTTLKLRTVELFTCMSCRRLLCVTCVTAVTMEVSVDFKCFVMYPGIVDVR